jgi:hypothetical protein
LLGQSQNEVSDAGTSRKTQSATPGNDGWWSRDKMGLGEKYKDKAANSPKSKRCPDHREIATNPGIFHFID